MHFYDRQQECDYLKQGVFVVSQSKEDISDCKVIRQVATATKFWSKWTKISQNWR